MLQKIIQFSLNNKIVIFLLVFALIVLGVRETTRLPIDAVPDITDNQVQVITVSPSLGAPDIERLITFPIEQASSNIPGMKQIRSFSRFGLSVITLVFEDDVDIYWARQQVSERLQDVQDQLPKGFGKPGLAPVTTGLGEIYQYVVRPAKGYENKYGPLELRTIQDWIVRRQLRDVKGVADVSSFGGYLKQYEIAVNPDKLKSLNLTIGDVFRAVEANNENAGGAYIDKGPTVLYIRTEGLTKSIEDIEQIPVRALSSGLPVLLKDVATVGIGHANRYGAMSYNGEREVAGAVVMMLKGANSAEVIKSVKDRVEQIKKSLPEGVIIEPFLDRTKMVNNAIGTVEQNLLEGALIVLFVLIIFLGNVRAGLLVASVIPLSMLFAIIMMNLFKVSGNLMSLGAIDFGLLVDGTVIIVEAVLHQLHKSHKSLYTRQEMESVVHDTSRRMLNASVFGAIIILIVYVPILTLQGIEGKMFKPMALTVAFALAGAFLLSLTYVPVMSSLVMSRKQDHKKTFADNAMHKLQVAYQPILEKTLGHPKIVIFTSVLLISIAGTVMYFLGGEFIPRLEEGDFAIETRVLPGSSLSTSVKAVSTGARILREKFPEVLKVVGKTGSSEIPTDPMPLDASDMIVVLKDKKEWTSAKTFDELTEKMTKELENIPGVTFGFQFPVQMRFNELMTGARQDVVCKIFGENLDSLAHFAQELGAIAGTVPGAADVYVEAVTGMPQIVIEYNRKQMAYYGLSVADVNRIVNTAFAGQSTGQVFEGERRFDLVVRLAGDQRKNLEDVRNLLIATQNGLQVPLNMVANVDIKESTSQIQRENAKRRIIVGFNVRGRDVQSVIGELQQKVAVRMNLPAGYYTTYGGSFENLQEAKQRLAIAVPASLLLIFFMLYLAFGSFSQGLLIFSAIPLSAVGGVLALAIRGMPFSISAGIGFIALFGVAVLNGIVLISEFNRLKDSGMTDLQHIVLEGTRSRLRPVLMTACVASLGFLPMALSHGAGAEVQRPLATVVIGGLITATLLTLFVLPVLYVRFQKPGLKLNSGNIGVLIAMILLAVQPASAQKTITLQHALDSAMKNNTSVRISKLNSEQKRALTTGAWNLPQTSLTGEFGHVNSYYADNKLGISQSISFPTVYVRQHQLMKEEWESALLGEQITEMDTRRQVSLLYNNICWLLRKLTLLNTTDSLYTELHRKAALRLEKGESNALELAAAEAQKGHVLRQRMQAEQDLKYARKMFGYLLMSDEDLLPDTSISLGLLYDTLQLDQHPFLLQALQQKKIAHNSITVERAKMMPELMATYGSQTFTGWQRIDNSERFFTNKDRFNYVQAGIGLPVFNGGQRSRIKALKLSEQIAELQLQTTKMALAGKHEVLTQQYAAGKKQLAYYIETGLKNAATVIKVAELRYTQGEINYLEYVMLINQAIATESDYLDAQKELNATIIELNNLIN